MQRNFTLEYYIIYVDYILTLDHSFMKYIAQGKYWLEILDFVRKRSQKREADIIEKLYAITITITTRAINSNSYLAHGNYFVTSAISNNW